MVFGLGVVYVAEGRFLCSIKCQWDFLWTRFWGLGFCALGVLK